MSIFGNWNQNLLQKSKNVNCIIDILSTHNNWDMKEIKEKFSNSNKL